MTLKQTGLLHYIKILSVFLVLSHLFILKADYNRFSTAVLKTFHHFKIDSEQECNRMYLEHNTKSPMKCNSNYCNNFSSFFTTSFSSFTFNSLWGRDIRNRFFLYNDPAYSSFFNSIWIPPKINC